jgi:putative ubiquitin-RnfH superfamily antitoxin RatB of RatAB toxin-antitoxin module
MKKCTVVFAMPERQWTWNVALPDGATVAEALELARAQAAGVDVPWNADTGIFGELCDGAAVPRDGDRIEIYRALKADPKESRRARARAGKAAQDREPSRPPK